MSPAAAATAIPFTAPVAAPASAAAETVLPLPLGTLPQPWYTIGQHALQARLPQDDQSRLDFVTHLNYFLARRPGHARRFRRARAGCAAGQP